MSKSSGITADLDTWDNIKKQSKWSGILLGNGSSQTLSNRFAYDSLFSKAVSDEITHPLTPTDTVLFRELGNTTNFEKVLADLLTAGTVNKAIGLNHVKVRQRYHNIRRALIEAIHLVHLPWCQLSDATKKRICNELRRYKFVFTTNYDLILYWCIMTERTQGFRDYFWNTSHTFDTSDTKTKNAYTKILYLHGALHLYKTAAGHTAKEIRGDRSLLDCFSTKKNRIPLFISEGSSRHKKRAIAQSDYLSFALNTLSMFDGPLVVFGHSLSHNDNHIVAAIRRQPHRKLAYSIYTKNASRIIREKSRIIGLFPGASITFFDASTHPLGKASTKPD